MDGISDEYEFVVGIDGMDTVDVVDGVGVGVIGDEHTIVEFSSAKNVPAIKVKTKRKRNAEHKYNVIQNVNANNDKYLPKMQ